MNIPADIPRQVPRGPLGYNPSPCLRDGAEERPATPARNRSASCLVRPPLLPFCRSALWDFVLLVRPPVRAHASCRSAGRSAAARDDSDLHDWLLAECAHGRGRNRAPDTSWTKGISSRHTPVYLRRVRLPHAKAAGALLKLNSWRNALAGRGGSLIPLGSYVPGYLVTRLRVL